MRRAFSQIVRRGCSADLLLHKPACVCYEMQDVSRMYFKSALVENVSMWQRRRLGDAVPALVMEAASDDGVHDWA